MLVWLMFVVVKVMQRHTLALVSLMSVVVLMVKLHPGVGVGIV